MVSRLPDDENTLLKGSFLLHQLCCYTAQDTVRDVITWFVASSHSNTSSHNNSNNNTKFGSSSSSSSSSCSTMSSPPTEAAAKQELLIDRHEKQVSIEKIEISVKEEVVKEEEEEEIEEEPKIIKKNKTTKSQESFVNNTSQHTINNSNSSGSTSFSKHKKQNPKLKLNRKKENSKSKLSKASKKSASSYFVRATKHIIVKTFGGVTSKNKSLSKSDPSTATTMMTEHKRKFDLMDADLAEDGDTDLEDVTSRDEEEDGHVVTDLEDAVVRDEEEEGHDQDGDDLSTSKTTTTGIQLKKNEDDDPGNISIELTPTFDSVDVDLAEDVDTDLEDTVDCDKKEEGHDHDDGDDPWHMTVENVITEIIKEQQEQDQDQDQEHKSVVGSEDIASFLVSCPFLTSVLLSLLIVEIENQEDVSRSTSIDDIPPPPPPPPPKRHSIPYSVLLPTDNDGEAPPSPIRKTIKYWEEKSLNDSIFSSDASFFDIPLPPTTGRLSASQLYLFENDDDYKRNIGPIDSNESYDAVHVEELRHDTSLDNGYKNLPRMSAITHDSVTSLNTLPLALSTSKFSGERRSTRHNCRLLRKSGDQRTMIIVILCITFGISFVDDIFDYCEKQSTFHVHEFRFFSNNIIVDDNNKNKNNNNTDITFLVNDDEASSSSRSSTLMKRKQIHQQQRQQYWDEHIVSTFL